MTELTITKDNFEKEVLQSTKPVLIDFWAPWCGPCRMLAPTMAEIAAENDQIKVGKINVDEESELSTKFDIMSIPTIMVFKDGKLTNSTIGFQPKAAILSLLAD